MKIEVAPRTLSWSSLKRYRPLKRLPPIISTFFLAPADMVMGACSIHIQLMLSTEDSSAALTHQNGEPQAWRAYREGVGHREQAKAQGHEATCGDHIESVKPYTKPTELA
jgi:hypothetical protein